MQLDRQTAPDLMGEGNAAFRQGDPYDASPYIRYGYADQQFSYRFWTKGGSAAQTEHDSAQQPARDSAGQ
ncbi:hypothetical protein [Streptomyces zhihengii]|uniref:Uncharacterized protein n=1 Tax=Streptomyces zhihengii TaxID=1818004 RepID=A0ABS2V7X8_9ACTN|nr:hypothetical protein [Streptomyces zhihengii]MBM9624765.1 hypothetical protein [Streptomyces zhihengii]